MGRVGGLARGPGSGGVPGVGDRMHGMDGSGRRLDARRRAGFPGRTIRIGRAKPAPRLISGRRPGRSGPRPSRPGPARRRARRTRWRGSARGRRPGPRRAVAGHVAGGHRRGDGPLLAVDQDAEHDAAQRPGAVVQPHGGLEPPVARVEAIGQEGARLGPEPAIIRLTPEPRTRPSSAASRPIRSAVRAEVADVLGQGLLAIGQVRDRARPGRGPAPARRAAARIVAPNRVVERRGGPARPGSRSTPEPRAVEEGQFQLRPLGLGVADQLGVEPEGQRPRSGRSRRGPASRWKETFCGRQGRGGRRSGGRRWLASRTSDFLGSSRSRASSASWRRPGRPGGTRSRASGASRGMGRGDSPRRLGRDLERRSRTTADQGAEAVAAGEEDDAPLRRAGGRVALAGELHQAVERDGRLGRPVHQDDRGPRGRSGGSGPRPWSRRSAGPGRPGPTARAAGRVVGPGRGPRQGSTAARAEDRSGRELGRREREGPSHRETARPGGEDAVGRQDLTGFIRWKIGEEVVRHLEHDQCHRRCRIRCRSCRTRSPGRLAADQLVADGGIPVRSSPRRRESTAPAPRNTGRRSNGRCRARRRGPRAWWFLR